MPKKIKDHLPRILTALSIISVILLGANKMFSDVNKRLDKMETDRLQDKIAMNKRLDKIESKTDLIKSEGDLKRIAYAEAKNFYIDMLKINKREMP